MSRRHHHWASPLTWHSALACHALGAARFLTLNGSTKGERVFWRIGAAISAFGASVAIASELGTLAALLTLEAWRSTEGLGRLALQILVITLTAYFAAGLIRGIREPLMLRLPGDPRP